MDWKVVRTSCHYNNNGDNNDEEHDNNGEPRALSSAVPHLPGYGCR